MVSPGAFMSTSKATSMAAYARRNVDVEGVEIVGVATPIERRAVGGDSQRGEVVERSGRAVFARNPLRVDDRKASGRSGNALAHLHDAVGGARRVEDERCGVIGRGVRRRSDEAGGGRRAGRE